MACHKSTSATRLTTTNFQVKLKQIATSAVMQFASSCARLGISLPAFYSSVVLLVDERCCLNCIMTKRSFNASSAPCYTYLFSTWTRFPVSMERNPFATHDRKTLCQIRDWNARKPKWPHWWLNLLLQINQTHKSHLVPIAIVCRQVAQGCIQWYKIEAVRPL